MKPCKVCLALMGLLLMFVSCSSGEVTKSDTEAFLSGLNTMVFEAMSDQSTMIITDFQAYAPPIDAILSDYVEILEDASTGKLRNPDPYGLDTLYGTYHLYMGDWICTDSLNPADAILFEWENFDTVEYEAFIRVDSLDFYEGITDTLPTSIWVGIGMDGALLAWLKFEAEYVSGDVVSSVSLIYEIVDYLQVGIAMTSDVDIDTSFTGTVSLWAENLTNDYKVDLDVTVDDDYPEEIELSDSYGWDMDILFLDIVETDTVDYTVYEKIEVEGEITKNGNHAADIDGYVWEPEDTLAHMSEITVTFSNGTDGDLEDYLALEIPELP